MAKKDNKSSLKRTRPFLRRVLKDKNFRDCFSYGLLSSMSQTKKNGKPATDFSERLAPHVTNKNDSNVFGGLYYILKTMVEFTRKDCICVDDIESVCSTLTYLARIAPRQFVSLNWTSALPSTYESWIDDEGLMQSVTFPRFRHVTKVGKNNLRHNFDYSLIDKVVIKLEIPYNSESRLAVELAIEMGWMLAEADLGVLDINTGICTRTPKTSAILSGALSVEAQPEVVAEPETEVLAQTGEFFTMSEIEDKTIMAQVVQEDINTKMFNILSVMEFRLAAIEKIKIQSA